MAMKTGAECAERYELLRELGAGAMGSVHLAMDRQLNRRVALKFLHGSSWSDEALDRFFEEAAILARLRHPNVVDVLDHGDRYEIPYIAFEYIDGPSLLGVIRDEGPLPLERARRWARQLCEGVAHAHERGMLHRDLKSENVMVTELGDLKITDFGLALRGDRRQELTATGTIMGTPGYISPEQAAGRKALPASDQYSTAIIVFEMLGARLPFQGATVADMLMAHLKEIPPSVRRFRPDCPPDLADVIHRALAKTAEDRWPDVTAFGEALDRAFDGAASPGENLLGTLPSSESAAPGRPGRASEGSPMRTALLKGSDGSGPGVRGKDSPSPRLLAPVLLSVLSLLLAGTWLWNAHRSDPLPRETLAVETGTHSARIRWQSSRPMAFSWQLETRGRRLLSGVEASPTTSHCLPLHRLSPEGAYRIRLQSGSTRVETALRTPKVRLLRGVWTWGWNGALMADFESNGEGRFTFHVQDPKGKKGQALLTGPGPLRVVLGGFVRGQKGNFIWRLESEGRELASGVTPVQDRGLVLPGRSWNRFDRSMSPARTVGKPLTRGDEIYTCDDGGLLTCFRRERISGGQEHGGSPPLRPAWVFEAPGQPSLANQTNRSPGGLTLLPDGRLLFAVSLADKGRIQLWCIDPEERGRRWTRHLGRIDVTEFLARKKRNWPPGWQDPSSPREWTRSTAHHGRPLACGLLRGGKAYLLTGLFPSPSTPRPFHLFQLDLGTKDLQDLGGWPEDEAGQKVFWRFYEDLRFLGDHGIVTARHPDQVLKGKYFSHSIRVLAFPLDGSKARTCFTFQSHSMDNPLFLDPTDDTIRVCGSEGILEWKLGDWDRAPSVIEVPKFDDSALHYLSGCPIRHGGIDYLFVFRPEGIHSKVLEYTDYRGELTTRLLTRRQGGFHLHATPLGGSYANRQLSAMVNWELWKNVLAVNCGDLLLMVDLKDGRFQARGGKGHESLTISDDGVVFTTDRSGRLHTMPIELFLASSTQRVDGLPLKP